MENWAKMGSCKVNSVTRNNEHSSRDNLKLNLKTDPLQRKKY